MDTNEDSDEEAPMPRRRDILRVRGSKVVAAGLLSLAAAGSLPASGAGQEDERSSLEIMSFNIAFYGLNGDHDGVQGSETRDPTIRRFLEDADVEPDVLAMQELVDVPRFQRNVLGSGYACRSYDHSDSRHQHVAICHKRSLRLEVAPDDDNYTLESVTVGNPNLRPAVHGILTTSSGRELVHVFAVHLKAGTDFSSTRLAQARALERYIQNREDDLPVIVLGDLNTHGSDPSQIGNVLSTMTEVRNPAAKTFRVPDAGYKFDRAWLTDDLSATSVRVPGPCNLSNGSSATAAVKAYNRDVSDHCPLVLSLGL
jgi:endonuclease/exonuclease/phosphatase family metal-dependent hydrolase